MTINHRTVVGFSDIFALEYECPECHGRYAIPLERLENVICDCPNCHKAILDAAPTRNVPSIAAQVQQFVDSLKKFVGLRESERIRFILSDPDGAPGRVSDAKV
jgi:ribosomal protein L37AE/L43A